MATSSKLAEPSPLASISSRRRECLPTGWGCAPSSPHSFDTVSALETSAPENRTARPVGRCSRGASWEDGVRGQRPPVLYADDDICTSARPPVSVPVRLQTPSDHKKRYFILNSYFMSRCLHRPVFQRCPFSGSKLSQRGTQSILFALPNQAGCEFHFQSVPSRVYFPHYIYRPKERTLTYFQPCFKGQTSQRISPVFRGINTPKVPPVLNLR